MIDCDRLFKELLETFFPEFLQLFFPELWNAIEPNSLSFQDKELFTDITSGEKYAADLVIQARLKYGKIPILIHLEHQARSESSFPRRMFIYFCRLLENTRSAFIRLPCYPSMHPNDRIRITIK